MTRSLMNFYSVLPISYFTQKNEIALTTKSYLSSGK